MKKKFIVVEILLLFVLAVLIAIFCQYFHAFLENIARGDQLDGLYLQWAKSQLTYSIFIFLACVADIAVMVIIALQNFKAFQPLIDKNNARKQERAAVRAAKAESAKQKRIAELQAELQELNDDNKN